jgi:hypothetical protein
MISLIIFIVGVIVTYTTSFIFLGESIGFQNIAWMCLLAILGMIAINLVVATICAKWLSDKWYTKKSVLFTVGKKEYRFYEKIGIKKWKDDTAEMGFLNNFRKNKIKEPNNIEYIEKFIIETNKGFIVHFVSLFATVGAIFVMPKNFWLPMALPIAITSLILNIIPLMILRYNMPRLQIMLKYAKRNLSRKQENDQTKSLEN